MFRANVQKKQTFDGHRDSVYCLTPSRLFPNGFYSAGGDGIVALWNENDETSAKGILQAPMAIYALCEAGDLLIAGQSDGTLYWVNIKTATLVKAVKTHRSSIFDLLFLPEQKWLYACGAEGMISVWDVDTQTCMCQTPVSNDSLRTLHYWNKQELLFTAGKEQRIFLLSKDAQKILSDRQAHKGSVFRLTMQGNKLFSVSRDAHIHVWDTDHLFELEAHPIQSVVAHHYAINDLVFSPDGIFFATGSMDKTIKIWHADTLQLIKVIDHARNGGHRSSVNRLIWNENGLISASDDAMIYQWEIICYEV